MTCQPSEVITSEDIARLKCEIDFITEVAESNALTATSCAGKLVNTLTGQLTLLGFQPPIPYVAGIDFTVADGTKTVEFDGLIYAPIPSALPFTTSGTFVGDDDARFFLVQGVYLYGGEVIIARGTVGSMASDASLQLGNVVMTMGYTTVGDGGGALYEIVAAATGPADGGAWIDLAASGYQAQSLSVMAGVRNVIQWGAIGDGVTDDTVAVQSAINFASVVGGGTLQFPVTAGGSVYKMNATVPSFIHLEGANRTVTLIPAVDAPVIELDPLSSSSRVTVQNLTIDGSATKLAFTAQDGIRSEPGVGFIHSQLTVINVLITECGAAGIALVGGDVTIATQRVNNASILRSGISLCEGPGLLVRHNVALTSIRDCTVLNNGNEATDDQSNITIEAGVAGGFPEVTEIVSCQIATGTYLVTGNAIAILGALTVVIQGCVIYDFNTGIYLGDNAANGQVTVRDCSFERAAGDIVALANLVKVNGFEWSNNNVNPLTTGPVGIAINGPVSDVLKIDIGSSSSWGGLDKATDQIPSSIVSAGSVNLSRRSGLVRIDLVSDGIEDLNNIYDENGGGKQLLPGDTVTLGTSLDVRDVTVKHGVGNILLDGGLDMLLDTTHKTLVLMWSGLLWVEISRANNL